MAEVLRSHIPASFELQSKQSFGPVHLYKHTPSGAPFAAVVGGYQGEILGGILYFRSEHDEMNMEIEVPTSMMASMVSFIETRLPLTQPRDTMDGLWERFLDNFLGRIAGKRGFTTDGTPTPILQLVEQRPSESSLGETEADVHAPEEYSQGAEDPASAQAGPVECMICLERAADTVVMPCEHSVVCAECSRQLKETPDAHVCCQCRRPITGVRYPED